MFKWILIIFLILILSILLLVKYLYDNPTLAFFPYNVFVNLITSKQVFYTSREMKEIFPTSIILEDQYLQIKREALNIFNLINGNLGQDYIDKPESFYDGWKTFPLRIFGQNMTENMNMCPTLSKILNKCKDQVPTAFFSVMEPGKRLDAHYGPFKGILRYHLGLSIPPKESGPCFISVDGITYSWKEGEGVLFDETYLHFVHNDTPYHRIILFLDVKRPFQTTFMNKINDLILGIINLSPHNQKVVKKNKKDLLNTLVNQL